MNNGLQLTIANNSTTRYIAIRPKNYHEEKDLDQYPVPYAKEIVACLESSDYVNTSSWLGMKDFSRISVGNVNETADGLIAEIVMLVDRIYAFSRP